MRNTKTIENISPIKYINPFISPNTIEPNAKNDTIMNGDNLKNR